MHPLQCERILLLYLPPPHKQTQPHPETGGAELISQDIRMPSAKSAADGDLIVEHEQIQLLLAVCLAGGGEQHAV